MLLAVAKVWHYWIGFVIAIGSVLAVVATIVGYARKMSSLKYPRR